jgi:hypothetical protein
MNRLDKLKIKHKGGNNMNREQAKKMLPIIQAFAEDKTVQFKWSNGAWIDFEKGDEIDPMVLMEKPQNYRVKPNSEYRPFKNTEECWQEMLKHKPFGWVKYKEENKYTTYCNINDNCDFQADFEDFNFTDGTPFGIKE